MLFRLCEELCRSIFSSNFFLLLLKLEAQGLYFLSVPRFAVLLLMVHQREYHKVCLILLLIFLCKARYQRGHSAQYSGFKLAISTFMLSILEFIFIATSHKHCAFTIFIFNLCIFLITIRKLASYIIQIR